MKIRRLLATLALAWLPALTSFAACAQASGKTDQAATLASSLNWQLRIAQARPKADETLYVVMHSAKDCGWCQKWKREPSGLAAAKKVVDTYPNVRFFIVERDALDAKERSNQYPVDLRSEYERRAAADDLDPAVPMFEIFLRNEVYYRASGLGLWLDRVIPAIRLIESHREP